MIRDRATESASLSVAGDNLAAMSAGDFGGGQRVTRAQLDRYLPPPKPHPFEDGDKHIVHRLNGENEPVSLPAQIQWIGHPWTGEMWTGESGAAPYSGAPPVYIPEKNRVLMLLQSCGISRCPALIHSDDQGRTWSPRRWLSADDLGLPDPFVSGAMGLTYLGQGELICFSDGMTARWFSSDCGQTWLRSDVNVSPGGSGTSLVQRGVGDRIECMAQTSWKPTGVPFGSAGSGYGSSNPYSQAYLRTSADQGQTWSADVKVPQWLGVNEVSIVVAANGDWVAACRIEPPEQFVHLKNDEYGGLGISISKDQGATWSDVNILYRWGRHHSDTVLLPDGRILMSYVVRMGYPNTPDGFPQSGVETVLSNDHGQTWDLDHRYVLATSVGRRKDMAEWCSPSCTCTIALPDGTLLTTFTSLFRNEPGVTYTLDTLKTDIILVRWREE